MVCGAGFDLRGLLATTGIGAELITEIPGRDRPVALVASNDRFHVSVEHAGVLNPAHMWQEVVDVDPTVAERSLVSVIEKHRHRDQVVLVGDGQRRFE